MVRFFAKEAFGADLINVYLVAGGTHDVGLRYCFISCVPAGPFSVAAVETELGPATWLSVVASIVPKSSYLLNRTQLKCKLHVIIQNRVTLKAEIHRNVSVSDKLLFILEWYRSVCDTHMYGVTLHLHLL